MSNNTRIAVVGGGVSGLAVAQLLKDRYSVKIFERELQPGGLIRCKRVDGSLFHLCGGHVFNTKNEAVSSWFWSRFDKENDFLKAVRHSAVCLEDGSFVDYPIENHVYQLDERLQESFHSDLRAMIKYGQTEPQNFGEFLLGRFGRTLYDLYFKPYNSKIWRRDLSQIPLSWLDGKLPMPTPKEMMLANKRHLEETSFVHSSFYYAKRNGSQFIADVLAKGLDISYGNEVVVIEAKDGGVDVGSADGSMEHFDRIVYCGNVKDLPVLLRRFDLMGFVKEIGDLESHGTTAVFCETDPVPYSWFYQPSVKHDSHRFICTGNFSPENNSASHKMTCTIEFTDEMSADLIKSQLSLMPFHPRYITHHYSRYTYPIQHHHTRRMIQDLRENLKKHNIFLVGRFAEWEYYNMDAAIASAMRMCQEMS